jgi:exodeoxyribonuclease VII large subunit
MGARLNQSVVRELREAKAGLASVMRSAFFRDRYSRLRICTQRIDELSHRLIGAIRHHIAGSRRRSEPLSRRLEALHPRLLVEQARSSLQRSGERLRWTLGHLSKLRSDELNTAASKLIAAHPRSGLALARQKVDSLQRQIEAMSHKSVLKRGFSLTRRYGGKLIRSAADVSAGETVETVLHDGAFKSVVDGPAGTAKPRPARTIKPDAAKIQMNLFDPEDKTQQT